jgi:hypothetical protein
LAKFGEAILEFFLPNKTENINIETVVNLKKNLFKYYYPKNTLPNRNLICRKASAEPNQNTKFQLLP